MGKEENVSNSSAATTGPSSISSLPSAMQLGSVTSGLQYNSLLCLTGREIPGIVTSYPGVTSYCLSQVVLRLVTVFTFVVIPDSIGKGHPETDRSLTVAGVESGITKRLGTEPQLILKLTVKVSPVGITLVDNLAGTPTLVSSSCISSPNCGSSNSLAFLH